jgi:serine/threonine protein kinase
MEHPRYQIIKKIGHGQYGDVFLVERHSTKNIKTPIKD